VPEVLIASDSDFVHAEVESVLAGSLDGEDVTFRHLRNGRQVLPDVEAQGEPDLYVIDLQIGSMGGMATAMAIRLDEGAGRLIPTPIIMLLDRRADDFLARRSGADDWFVKPVNPVRLRRSAEELLVNPPGATDTDDGSPPADSATDDDLDLFEEGEWLEGAAEAGEVETA